jgi:hypothetical protein
VTSQPPPSTPGHHRFVWDLHYAKPSGLAEDSKLMGVLAPPGRYTVELTAGGQVLRQPLTVLADPRVKVSQAEFEAQFRLATQIEEARVRVRRMLQEAKELKTNVAAVVGPQGASALNPQLSALVGEDAPIGGSNPPATLTAISDWLDKLASAVEGADGAPTPDNLSGFGIVSAALRNIEPRWHAFAASARAHLPPAH